MEKDLDITRKRKSAFTEKPIWQYMGIHLAPRSHYAYSGL